MFDQLSPQRQQIVWNFELSTRSDPPKQKLIYNSLFVDHLRSPLKIRSNNPNIANFNFGSPQSVFEQFHKYFRKNRIQNLRKTYFRKE